MADTNNQYSFLDYSGLTLFWNNIKKIIEDNEFVTATALTNLDTRVDTLEGLTSPFIMQKTYAELVELRDNNNLVPGQQYRIIDYETTTKQENTQSAGHQFDIIVTANDESTLNESARVIQHDGDTYFAESDLNAWQIWYCLDNDTERFSWAVPVSSGGKGVIYRMIDEFNNDCPYDFKNIMFVRYELNAPNPIGDNLNITRLYTNIKDQFINNHLVYIWAGIDNDNRYWEDDYKMVYSSTTGNTKAFYTFSNVIDGIVSDKSITGMCYSNAINEHYEVPKRKLNNIVFFDVTIDSICYFNSFGKFCHNNSIGNDSGSNNFGDFCYLNTVGGGCTNNTFGESCYLNSFGGVCENNTFGNSCHSNNFGYRCSSNSYSNECSVNILSSYCNYNIFGSGCTNNSFDVQCSNNIFGNECESNTFSNNCHSNIFGNACNSNTFGLDCHSNIFGSGCKNNTFRDQCNNNSFGNGCESNTFSNRCHSNIFGNSCNSNNFYLDCYANSFGNKCSNNSFDNECYYNSFSNGCSYNRLSYNCSYNSFDNSCYSNSLGDYCYYNSFGNGCKNNSFGNSCSYNRFDNDCNYNSFRVSGDNTSSLIGYCRYNAFDDGCSYNIIYSANTNNSTYLENYHINRGVKGTDSNPMLIDAQYLNAENVCNVYKKGDVAIVSYIQY